MKFMYLWIISTRMWFSPSVTRRSIFSKAWKRIWAIKVAEKALGKVSYEVGGREVVSRVFRQSFFVVKDMKTGEVFAEENVRSIRPGYGLQPRCLKEVLGRRAAHDLECGTPLEWEMMT